MKRETTYFIFLGDALILVRVSKEEFYRVREELTKTGKFNIRITHNETDHLLPSVSLSYERRILP